MQVTTPAISQTRRTMDWAYLIPLPLGGMATWRGMSDQRHQPALSVGVTVNVGLGSLNGSVTGKNLNVKERTACLMNEPGSPGDECPAARVRRASFQAYCTVCDGEKIDDGDWRHAAAALGPDQRTHAAGRFAPGGEGIVQIGMHSNKPSAFLLRGVVSELDYRRNVTCRVQNHRPRQGRGFS